MAANKAEQIDIEVAYARPDTQRVVRLRVPVGTTARVAVQLSGLEQVYSDDKIAESTLGVFGAVVADSAVVRAGDRVEIYRALLHEPQEARRLRANAKGK